MNLRKPKNHTAVDMYKAWCAELLASDPDCFDVYDYELKRHGLRVIYRRVGNGDKQFVMSYTMFKLIIEKFNKYAVEAIIQGESVTLGNNLGYVYPACIERNYNRLKCDIVATKRARKEDPNHPAVFFTEPDYCMIKWNKFHKTQNEKVYIFKPSKEFSKLFYSALRVNPILKTLYRFIPYKEYNYDSKLD